MILGFVILYLLLSVGIGLAAARRVHTAKDFAVAGRSLPLPIVIATVFATWFGAETVFGVILGTGVGGGAGSQRAQGDSSGQERFEGREALHGGLRFR